MKAIILTYDNRIELADLVISVYNTLIPQNKIEWFVPFNVKKPIFKSNTTNNIFFVKTLPDIRSTIKSLLNCIPNDEFVLWAFDDIYPIKINIDFFNSIINFIEKNHKLKANSIRLQSLKNIELLKNEIIDELVIDNFIFSNYFTFNSFWFHQFIKCKLLKTIFIKNNLGLNYRIRQVTDKCVPKHDCYIPNNNFCSFGETTRFNWLTKNAFDKLKEYNISIPNINIMNKAVIIDNRTISGHEELKEIYNQYRFNKDKWYHRK